MPIYSPNQESSESSNQESSESSNEDNEGVKIIKINNN